MYKIVELDTVVKHFWFRYIQKSLTIWYTGNCRVNISHEGIVHFIYAARAILQEVYQQKQDNNKSTVDK